MSVSCPQVFNQPFIDLPSRDASTSTEQSWPRTAASCRASGCSPTAETKAGVSIFFVNENIDAGELCGNALSRFTHETLDEFLRKSKAIAAELLLDVLEEIREWSDYVDAARPERGSYYSWPDREDVRRSYAAGRRVW